MLTNVHFTKWTQSCIQYSKAQWRSFKDVALEVRIQQTPQFHWKIFVFNWRICGRRGFPLVHFNLKCSHQHTQLRISILAAAHTPSRLLAGISCRKLHRTSQRGHFAPGFDLKTGNPIARTGYMVECLTDADCHRLCGRHPLTSSHYTCQKRFELFDYSLATKDKRVHYLTGEGGAGNVSDPREGMGICVDSNALLYQSCPNEGAANVMDTLIGCVRALYSNLRPPATHPHHPHPPLLPQGDRFIGRFLCGLEVHTKSGDPATATIHGNLVYPRVLVAGAEDTEGTGRSAPRMECDDPIQCVDRCKYLSRTSANGAGTPPTCALWCAAPCTLHPAPCTFHPPLPSPASSHPFSARVKAINTVPMTRSTSLIR